MGARSCWATSVERARLDPALDDDDVERDDDLEGADDVKGDDDVEDDDDELEGDDDDVKGDDDVEDDDDDKLEGDEQDVFTSDIVRARATLTLGARRPARSRLSCARVRRFLWYGGATERHARAKHDLRRRSVDAAAAADRLWQRVRQCSVDALPVRH